MSRRRSLTEAGVAGLGPGPPATPSPIPSFADTTSECSPPATKAFVTVGRDPAGKQVWTTIGPADALSLDDARAQGRDALTASAQVFRRSRLHR